MKIVIDGFGGDNSPDEVLKGCAMAVSELGVEIIVTGDEKKLREAIKRLEISENGISIAPARGIIEIADNPLDIRGSKADSSMGMAFRLLSDGTADAFVSAGSTAAIVVGGTTIAKRIKGIKRPSLAPIMPSVSGNYILLDGGANIECRPEMLYQFAVMGSCYMNRIMGVESPRVGLLNVGTEDEKGRELEIAANELLKKSKLNYVGNTEGREVPLGACDVIVTDGFTGNIYLKTVEGMGKFMKITLKDIFSANFGTKLAAAIVMNKMKSALAKMDYRKVGGSPLLGTAKPVFKAHGSSDALAFKNAIGQAKSFVEQDVIGEITKSLAESGETE